MNVHVHHGRTCPTVLAANQLTPDPINLTALRIDVRREVAIAKISEFENQAYRLGNVIAAGQIAPRTAADLLQDVAVANNLITDHGADLIQSVIANGLERK